MAVKPGRSFPDDLISRRNTVCLINHEPLVPGRRSQEIKHRFDSRFQTEEGVTSPSRFLECSSGDFAAVDVEHSSSGQGSFDDGPILARVEIQKS